MHAYFLLSHSFSWPYIYSTASLDLKAHRWFLANGVEQVISIPRPNMMMKASSLYHPLGITSKFAHSVVTHCSFLICLHIHRDVILLYMVHFLLYLFVLFQTDFVQSQGWTASRAVCNLWPSTASLCSLLIPYELLNTACCKHISKPFPEHQNCTPLV